MSKDRISSTASQTGFLNAIDTYFAAFLASVSLAIFFGSQNPTAFDWPAIDMGPFFERIQDPSFLTNDFFTNSSVKPNPRHIFGHLVMASSLLFGADWYTNIFGLKVILVAATPALYYLSCVRIVTDVTGIHPVSTRNRFGFRVSQPRLIVSIFLFAVVMLVLTSKVGSWVSVAWWPPISIFAGAHPTALIFGLLAIVVAGRRFHMWASVVCFFVATLLHPVIGVHCFAFFLVGTFNRVLANWKVYALQASIGIILPIILLTILFSPEASLSGVEFVYHYSVQSHSSHYLPSQFGSFTRYPWWVSFTAVLCLLVLPTLWVRGRTMQSLSMICALAYGSSVLLQYLFVELYPIKVIAVIGPSRFTAFGYWLLAIVYGCWVVTAAQSKFKAGDGHQVSDSAAIRIGRSALMGCLVLTVIVLASTTTDNPRDVAWNKWPSLFSWTTRNTVEESVFVVPRGPLRTRVRLFAHRAVFTGGGFPFREDFFAEHTARQIAVDGDFEALRTTEGSWIGAKYARHYRSLGPMDFHQLSKRFRVDYVVVESDHAENFQSYQAVFNGDGVNVYDVRDFGVLQTP